MADSSYLTIGEVLGLLLEEFPDVTISKIRFLESQGLVEPERTASGYRKFSDHDVDRLRYVMREQRTHYLPLRVIKDRLHESDLTSPGGPRPVPTGAAWATVDGGSDEVRQIVERATRIAAETPVSEPDPAPPDGVVVPIGPRASRVQQVFAPGHYGELDAEQPPTDVSPPAQRLPHADAVRHPSFSAGGAGLRAVDAQPTRPHNDPQREDESALRSAASEGPHHHAAAAAASDTVPGDDAPATAEHEHDALRNEGGSQRAAETSLGLQPSPTAHTPVSTVPAELSLMALMAATGATDALIADLQSYGLLAPRTGGATPVYDVEAIELVNIAKAFADRGIDARHLRTWRTNAEKEIGLFEQLVVPLVRQRNPQARDAAAELAVELSSLGADLRAFLVRNALRSYTER